MCAPYGKSWFQAFPAETVETGENCDVTNYIQKFSKTQCMFCETAYQRLMRKMSSFSGTGRSTESVVFFGTSEYSSVKKKDLNEQNFMVGCCKLSLYTK